MIGTTISHYKVLEKIGEGGMGEVYLAQDSRLNRKVALNWFEELKRWCLLIRREHECKRSSKQIRRWMDER